MTVRVTTREAAKKMGVAQITLQRHVAAKTVKAPALRIVGGVAKRLWSERDIERAKRVLASVKPGRKPKRRSEKD
jgi:hypothetical protein